MLAKRFSLTAARMKARYAGDDPSVWREQWAFHGSRYNALVAFHVSTLCLVSRVVMRGICMNGLLPFGHPLNPSTKVLLPRTGENHLVAADRSMADGGVSRHMACKLATDSLFLFFGS